MGLFVALNAGGDGKDIEARPADARRPAEEPAFGDNVVVQFSHDAGNLAEVQNLVVGAQVHPALRPLVILAQTLESLK
jgi:hypothetical protein